MSREKQIEEMARVLCRNALTEYCASGRCSNQNCLVNAKALETLYNAGYRKQEWISVEERLPQPQKLVLCIWERGDDRNNYGFARYQMGGVWYVSNEGMPRVTHWMPLPEPPKGE